MKTKRSLMGGVLAFAFALFVGASIGLSQDAAPLRNAIRHIWTIVIAVPVVALVTTLVHFNVKRLHIIRRARAATESQLERVYAALEQTGTESPICAMLGRTNREAADGSDLCISVPLFVEPWGGRVIVVHSEAGVTFRFTDVEPQPTVLRESIYRVIAVPRRMTRAGKLQNQFATSKHLLNNQELLVALSEICPRYPKELLSYLLSPGSESFEDGEQVRIGGSPQWVQDPEFPSCPVCRKRMGLILQLPGSLLPGKKRPEGSFYFFGCKEHLDETGAVEQFA